MRRIFCMAAMLTLLASLFSACDPGASNTAVNKPANAASNATALPAKIDTAAMTAIETEVKKLINEAAASISKNDVAAFEKMTADNYMLIGSDGRVSTRAERVASMKSGDTKFESVVYDEVTVRVNPYGTGAIAVSRATAKGISMGNKVDGQYRITQIWRRMDDGWKLAHSHVTAITVAAGDKKADAAPAANANK